MNEYADKLLFDYKLNDKSFTESPFLGGIFGGIKYTQSEVRDIWFKGIRHGIEIGLNNAPLAGPRIDSVTTKDPRHKKFYAEFLKLAEQYNCAMQYHPEIGMCVVDLGDSK